MDTPVFFTSSGFKARGKGLPTHTHEHAQLTFAASGMVQIHTDAGRWLVPPLLAVWVPAGMPHRAEVLTDAELWIVHCRTAALTPALADGRAFAVRVTPLLRALLDAAFTAQVDAQKADLLGQLMLHELTETIDAPTFLPMPTSAAAGRVAARAIADPGNRLDFAALTQRAATSVRTVSRLFPSETGLTFKAWRQRARIVHAMERLGRGDSIARVATACGFATTAAFSAAFRQVTGMTPTMFVGRQDANGNTHARDAVR